MAPQKVVSRVKLTKNSYIKGLLFNVQFIQVKLTKNSYIKGLLFNVQFIQVKLTKNSYIKGQFNLYKLNIKQKSLDVGILC
jgi:hypothetical protein